MKRYTYGVFLLDKSGKLTRGGRWARTNNKADAIKVAKRHGGEVRAMPYAHGDLTYDAPTFRLGSTQIFYAEKPRLPKRGGRR